MLLTLLRGARRVFCVWARLPCYFYWQRAARIIFLNSFVRLRPREDKWCARWSPTARCLFINKFREWNISTPQHDWAAIIIVCLHPFSVCLLTKKQPAPFLFSRHSFISAAWSNDCAVCCHEVSGAWISSSSWKRIQWVRVCVGCVYYLDYIAAALSAGLLLANVFTTNCASLSRNKSKKFTCYKIQLCLSTKEESGYPWD